MTSEEQKVYDVAVEFIESHGGIVLNPHETDLSIMTKIEMMIEDDSSDQEEFEQRKEDAWKKFNKMLGSKNFSYSAVEDMMLGHGLEMDYIEDFIHKP